jgi:hypothetical protein
MSFDTNRPVQWDGELLSGWIAIGGVPTKMQANRDTIHRYARGFNDAVTWEIDRHRDEIFERLVPFFTSTEISRPTSPPPQIDTK